MDFESQGYLGAEIVHYARENVSTNIDVFNFSEKLNRFLQKIKYEININNKSIADLVIATLFARMNNTYQAIIILYRYGLHSQAKSLIRNNLEALFVLKAICKNPTNVSLLIENDSKNRKRIYNKFTDKNNFINMQNKVNYEDTLDALKKELPSHNVLETHISEWANLAELAHLYATYYSFYSSEIHVDIRNLEQYASFDTKKNVSDLNDLPNTTTIKQDLLFSVSLIFEELVSINEYFKLDAHESISELKEEASIIQNQNSIAF